MDKPKHLLSLHCAIVDYFAKTMNLTMPGVLRFEWDGSSGSYHGKVIVVVWALALVYRGSFSYLELILDDIVEPFPQGFYICSLRVFRYASYWFSGVYLDRDIYFAIDLDLAPIPYLFLHIIWLKLNWMKWRIIFQICWVGGLFA